MIKHWTHGATVVWIVLMAMTAVSWLLGSPPADGAEVDSRVYATVGILLVSFLKVRLVILYFMDVRDAPMPLRLVCEGWTIGLALILVGQHLHATLA
ncbi:MAG: cytochrome C oxidase subunit IV family protein [Pseudomonadota bacterium]|nr:cytochrome C oxidase subunit IV family protein [Pseudomonadota bacterium]